MPSVGGAGIATPALRHVTREEFRPVVVDARPGVEKALEVGGRGLHNDGWTVTDVYHRPQRRFGDVVDENVSRIDRAPDDVEPCGILGP